NAEVRRRMRGALALCVPSVTAASGDSEGLPTVAIEAMAEGVPVIGTRHAGIVEAVVDGETGLLVPQADPRALAAAIQALCADPARRRAMGEAGRRRARAEFDAAVQSRKLEDLLLRLAG
ncbi:MAG: glycosyltransferase, partial [Rhodospirillales bacterium]|nr:glycosyltransferase [Rhodospirillales bacterium]